MAHQTRHIKTSLDKCSSLLSHPDKKFLLDIDNRPELFYSFLFRNQQTTLTNRISSRKRPRIMKTCRASPLIPFLVSDNKIQQGMVNIVRRLPILGHFQNYLLDKELGHVRKSRQCCCLQRTWRLFQVDSSSPPDKDVLYQGCFFKFGFIYDSKTNES